MNNSVPPSRISLEPLAADRSLSALRWQRLDTRLTHIESTLTALLSHLTKLEAIYAHVTDQQPWK